ncbi:50S ribosomal protein L31 [Leptolyngbya sp. 7M]|uniref:50S ribosomal protein L31 n=1 Tax=Leptolyngbya sp. 7M TaxID=2812896 RepID=UPI001B8C8DA1|nr:50S ribosomal protein L31 [Leptolyngbya sp. 7M]QYO64629.1 50S ribosomal protein L31 [Leptolyngbya sp. 7M]QYU66007.1 50S ribosomal protein L31 [Leptolyngbya sp. 15MV]
MPKSEIHPTYYPSCKVYHNGQVVMTVGATVPELHVEVWSGSHPFFTGKQTFIDSAGRVERFQRKYAGNYFQPKERAGPKAAKPVDIGTDKVQTPGKGEKKP